jgi:UDP:flavonoid glycosyltransferase YjiC (YdhE family)
LARILFTTFGSYGDIHPYMAIGIELQKRGHAVTIATSSSYAAKITSEGLGFHAVRPDISLEDQALLAYVMDARRGSERVVHYVGSVVRESYEDTLTAARQADLIVTHPIAFGGVMAAEKLDLPWISSVLAPISFLSACDPPVPAPTPWIVKVRALGPGLMRLIWQLAKYDTRRWIKPVLALRRELGLPDRGHPLFEGSHSPQLVLALFSRSLAEPQPDWPPNTVVTGFPFFDRHHEQAEMPPALHRFLSEGPPPIVFTLGSSAVGAAGDFYRDSLQAISKMDDVRALLLTGPHPQGLPETLAAGVMAVPYAAHSLVFPRASAIVHQGGCRHHRTSPASRPSCARGAIRPRSIRQRGTRAQTGRGGSGLPFAIQRAQRGSGAPAIENTRGGRSPARRLGARGTGQRACGRRHRADIDEITAFLSTT